MKLATIAAAILMTATAVVAAPAANAAPLGCYVTMKTLKADGSPKTRLNRADMRKIRSCAAANQGGGILDVLVNEDSSSAARYFGDLVVKAFVNTGGCSLAVGGGKGYQRSNCNVTPVADDPSGQTPAFTVTIMTQH